MAESSLFDKQTVLNPQPIGGYNNIDFNTPVDKSMFTSGLEPDYNTSGPMSRETAPPTVAKQMETQYNIKPISTNPDKVLAGAKLLQSALVANQNTTPTTSVGSAAVQAGGTALSTGIAGATIGSAILPGYGTAVGGAVGLAVGAVIGGAQAYFNVTNSRKQARQYEQLKKEALARADREKAQQMAIDAEGVRYNRAVAADAARVDRYNSVRASIVDTMNNDNSMKQNFIKQGFS